MQVVNLAGKPFLNRRPVSRIALLLWVLGALLLFVNVWVYTRYLAGTTKNRALLAEIDEQISVEEAALDQAVEEVRRLDLSDRNLRASFLNELIAQRTFPWSRLFDDLEDALHEDVYLHDVAPKVEERQVQQRRSRARTITPREARRRARQQQQGDSGQGGPIDAGTAHEEADDEPRYVELALAGTAKTDDAMLDFVDALYRNERFVDPFLSSERRQESGEIDFSVLTYYLVAAPARAEDEAPQTADTARTDGEGDSEGAGDEPVVTVAPPAGTAASDRRAGIDPPDAETRGNDPRSTSGPRARATTPSAQSVLDQRAEDRAVEERRAVESRQAAGTPTARDRRTLDRSRIRDGVTTQPAPRDGSSPATADTPGSETPSADTTPTDTTSPDTTSPEMTQPDASASPRLRQIGRLGAADAEETEA